jgi:RNA polymerase sigma-70 factor (ECF subfamily)
MGQEATRVSVEDLRLVERLRSGDEDAFMALVDRYRPAMLRIARMYVSTLAVAEEVVQDTWLGVLRGLGGFEGRSSLRTWISSPVAWDQIPEERLLAAETLRQVEMAIETLPPNQRAVIRLRDLQGWTSAEVCNALDIGETNQRVLLHRARSKVRRALERYLAQEGAG